MKHEILPCPSIDTRTPTWGGVGPAITSRSSRMLASDRLEQRPATQDFACPFGAFAQRKPESRFLGTALWVDLGELWGSAARLTRE